MMGSMNNLPDKVSLILARIPVSVFKRSGGEERQIGRSADRQISRPVDPQTEPEVDRSTGYRIASSVFGVNSTHFILDT